METQNGDAQALAFKEVKSTLGLSNRQLLEYVWWDAVGSDDGDGASVLVGVAAGGAIVQQTAPATPNNPP